MQQTNNIHVDYSKLNVNVYILWKCCNELKALSDKLYREFGITAGSIYGNLNGFDATADRKVRNEIDSALDLLNGEQLKNEQENTRTKT